MDNEQTKNRDFSLHVCRGLENLYHDNLMKEISDKHNNQLINFLNERKLTRETIKKFHLGYAPCDNYFLTNKISQIEDKIKKNDIDYMLHELGYVNPENKDFFYDRLIFPIHDEFGRTIGFGGRTLNSESRIKYLNSKESAIFKKNAVLFNLWQAKKSNSDTLYLVEGFMDAISLSQIGVTNVIALMGTFLSESHVQMLNQTNFKKIILCLDQDLPGQNATLNIARVFSAINQNKIDSPLTPDEWIKINQKEMIYNDFLNCLPWDLPELWNKNRISFLRDERWKIGILPKLPGNTQIKDIDEFIKKTSSTEVKNYLNNPLPYFTWYTNYLLNVRYTKINNRLSRAELAIQDLFREVLVFKPYLEPSELWESYQLMFPWKPESKIDFSKSLTDEEKFLRNKKILVNPEFQEFCTRGFCWTRFHAHNWNLWEDANGFLPASLLETETGEDLWKKYMKVTLPKLYENETSDFRGILEFDQTHSKWYVDVPALVYDLQKKKRVSLKIEIDAPFYDNDIFLRHYVDIKGDLLFAYDEKKLVPIFVDPHIKQLDGELHWQSKEKIEKTNWKEIYQRISKHKENSLTNEY